MIKISVRRARFYCYSHKRALGTHLRGRACPPNERNHHDAHTALTGLLFAPATADANKTNGSTVRMEVYLFAEFAPDGRFHRVEETTVCVAESTPSCFNRSGPNSSSTRRASG